MMFQKDDQVEDKETFIESLKGLFPKGNFPAERSIVPWEAYSLVMMVFLLGWGPPTYNAVMYLMGAFRFQDDPVNVLEAIQRVLETATVPMATLMLGIFILKFYSVDLKEELGLRGPYDVQYKRRFFLSMGVHLSSLAGSIVVGDMLFGKSSSYPGINDMTWMTFPSKFTSFVLAGPREELLLLALPVILLRKAGQSWARIITLCVVLRLSFHVFYGWHTLTMSIWALAILLVFIQFKQLLPLVVAHSMFNTINSVGQMIHEGVHYLMMLAWIGFLMSGLGYYQWRCKKQAQV